MPRGVLQSDPLSMALFCLAIAPLLAENQCMYTAFDSSLPGTIKAYADDWHPVGSAQQVRRAFQMFYSAAPTYGMEIAPEKCS